MRTAIGEIPPVLPDLGLSSAAQSVLATVPVVCFGLAALGAPALRARLGEERGLLAVLALLLAGVVLRAALPGGGLFPGTVLAGCAIAVMNVLVPSLVRRRFPGHVGLMTGVYTTALVSGGSLAAATTVPLRDAAGGSLSGFGPLALLPVFWVALYGTWPQLTAVLGGVVAVFYVPMLAIGGDAYPVESWRGGALYAVVAAIVGYTVQDLIARLRAVLDERNELTTQLGRLAETDPLTGLANRRAWDQALRDAIRAAQEHGTAVCVAVLDLDHFKHVNDSYGHARGDLLLRDAAAAWRAALRPGDFVARLGGEEFAVLLTGCRLAGALAVTERVRAATPSGQTCSAGIVEWDRSESPAALLARADRLLYQAKQRGRDRSVTEPASLLRTA
jgi:diguanylate cyclase (GGDEF)-like protein